MNYAEYLKSDHWIELRGAKLLEANWRCQKCKSRNNLQVHHLTYDRKGCERLDDLAVLCERCHEKEHNFFPVYVDDWTPPPLNQIRPPKKGKKRKPPIIRERPIHPLFKYVTPIKDGVIR